MSSRNICRRRSYKRNGIDVKKSVLRVYLRSMDQRDMRHDVINRNRKLPSPSDHVDLPPVKESRESSSSKSASPVMKPNTDKLLTRREMLKQWKDKKALQHKFDMMEKAKSKPSFIVGHVFHDNSTLFQHDVPGAQIKIKASKKLPVVSSSALHGLNHNTSCVDKVVTRLQSQNMKGNNASKKLPVVSCSALHGLNHNTSCVDKVVTRLQSQNMKGNNAKSKITANTSMPHFMMATASSMSRITRSHSRKEFSVHNQPVELNVCPVVPCTVYVRNVHSDKEVRLSNCCKADIQPIMSRVDVQHKSATANAAHVLQSPSSACFQVADDDTFSTEVDMSSERLTSLANNQAVILSDTNVTSDDCPVEPEMFHGDGKAIKDKDICVTMSTVSDDVMLTAVKDRHRPAHCGPDATVDNSDKSDEGCDGELVVAEQEGVVEDTAENTAGTVPPVASVGRAIVAGIGLSSAETPPAQFDSVFRTPVLPLSAKMRLEKRHRTSITVALSKVKSPEEAIRIISKSPLVELTRDKKRITPEPWFGDYVNIPFQKTVRQLSSVFVKIGDDEEIDSANHHSSVSDTCMPTASSADSITQGISEPAESKCSSRQIDLLDVSASASEREPMLTYESTQHHTEQSASNSDTSTDAVKHTDVSHHCSEIPTDSQCAADHTSCSANRDSLSVSFYRRILGENVDKITQLSDHWSAILDTTKSLPEEADGQIRSITLKSQLLIGNNGRIRQFSHLVDQCASGDKHVTLSDLQGFWEMVYMQAEDMYSQFGALETMKENNWQTDSAIDVPKAPVNRRAKKRTVVNKTCKSTGLSKFAAFRAEKKLHTDADKYAHVSTIKEKVFDAGFFKLNSPVRPPQYHCEGGTPSKFQHQLDVVDSSAFTSTSSTANTRCTVPSAADNGNVKERLRSRSEGITSTQQSHLPVVAICELTGGERSVDCCSKVKKGYADVHTADSAAEMEDGGGIAVNGESVSPDLQCRSSSSRQRSRLYGGLTVTSVSEDGVGEDERLVRCSDKGTDSASRPDKEITSSSSMEPGQLDEHSTPSTVHPLMLPVLASSRRKSTMKSVPSAGTRRSSRRSVAFSLTPADGVSPSKISRTCTPYITRHGTRRTLNMVDKDSVRDETGELSEETDVRTNIRRPPLRRSTRVSLLYTPPPSPTATNRDRATINNVPVAKLISFSP